MKLKEAISKLLLAFVIFSIGFAAGKEMAARNASESLQSDLPLKDGLAVMFFHARFRCVTCNSMEELAKQVLERDFAELLDNGEITWQVINFQDNTELARRFDVGSSTIVVAQIQDGGYVDFQRLDEVWAKVGNPDEFKAYVRDAVSSFVTKGDV